MHPAIWWYYLYLYISHSYVHVYIICKNSCSIDWIYIYILYILYIIYVYILFFRKLLMSILRINRRHEYCSVDFFLNLFVKTSNRIQFVHFSNSRPSSFSQVRHGMTYLQNVMNWENAECFMTWYLSAELYELIWLLDRAQVFISPKVYSQMQHHTRQCEVSMSFHHKRVASASHDS